MPHTADDGRFGFDRPRVPTAGGVMDECLAYFRAAVADPASVPPWADWWAANADRVAEAFPLLDYVRLKHRGLAGARQVLQRRGELPPDDPPPEPAPPTGSPSG